MNTKKNADRTAFEKWVTNACCYADLQLDNDGDYENVKTIWAWKGWQAAKDHYATSANLPETEATQSQLTDAVHQ